LTGVIEKLVAEDRCAIAIEGGASGVLVVVSAQALEMADPLSHLGRLD
jgi:hypothetical protein